MAGWPLFAAILGSGVLATQLAILLALRRLTPRPDLTAAWSAWTLTMVLLLAALVATLAGLGGGPPPGSTPVPTPTPP